VIRPNEPTLTVHGELAEVVLAHKVETCTAYRGEICVSRRLETRNHHSGALNLRHTSSMTVTVDAVGITGRQWRRCATVPEVCEQHHDRPITPTASGIVASHQISEKGEVLSTFTSPGGSASILEKAARNRSLRRRLPPGLSLFAMPNPSGCDRPDLSHRKPRRSLAATVRARNSPAAPNVLAPLCTSADRPSLSHLRLADVNLRPPRVRLHRIDNVADRLGLG